MKRVLGCIRKAVQDYNMIEDGENIAVGVSGGKDSIALLYALKLFQRFSPVKYELEAITVTLGFENFGLTPIIQFCEEIDVNLTIKETLISKIVFDVKEEKNPCSLCAKLRRGALNKTAKKLGCKTVALGHHADDAIETLFMSLFYSGRFATFSPKTYLDRKDIYTIRPMIYAKETDIIGAVRRNNLPIVESACPIDKKTKREEMKQLMKHIYKDIPQARKRIITAMKNKDQLNLWFDI